MVNPPGDLLLEKARHFNLDALAEVYDRYSPGIYRYAMKLLGNSSLAEDCVAETFSRLLKAFRGGGGPTNYLQAYLYRIAHHWITDYYRRQPPTEWIETKEMDLELTGSQGGSENDPILHQQIRSALMRLTPEQRQVIVLKYIIGEDNEEIALALKKPVGAVKSLQHRALEALRRLLLPKE
jgi:RNA polymerase sigma-70 factor (ECF subfamily)